MNFTVMHHILSRILGKSLIIAGVCLTLLFPADLSGQVVDSLARQSKAQEFFDDALANYKQRNLETARHRIKQAITLDEHSVSFWKLALDIARERGDVDEMAETLAELIRLEPTERRHYTDRAYVLAYMKAFDEALGVHDQFREQFGMDEEAILGKVRIYQAMDNRDAAIKELENLMEHDPRESTTYITLAGLYTVSGRSAEAMEVLDKAAGLFPGNPFVHLAKADAYQAAGNLTEAYRHLESGFSDPNLEIDAKAGILYNMLDQQFYTREQVLALIGKFTADHPADPRSHAVSGDIQARLEHYEEAQQSYQHALDLNRLVPGIWQQLLQLLLFRGEIEEAKRVGEEAIVLFPRDSDILLATGNAYLIAKDYPLARKHLEAALNNADQDNSQVLTWIYGTLGGVYHALEMHNESDVAFSEALVHDSLNVFALNNYAYYLSVRKERLEEAAAMSSRTLELQPGEATYEDTYAWILFQMERYEEALVWIRKAIGNSVKPSPTLLEHHGDILYMNGRRREAVNQWKKAMKEADASYENLGILARKIDEKRLVD